MEYYAILNGTSLYAWILHFLLSNQLRDQQTYKLYINTVSVIVKQQYEEL